MRLVCSNRYVVGNRHRSPALQFVVLHYEMGAAYPRRKGKERPLTGLEYKGASKVDIPRVAGGLDAILLADEGA